MKAKVSHWVGPFLMMLVNGNCLNDLWFAREISGFLFLMDVFEMIKWIKIKKNI